MNWIKRYPLSVPKQKTGKTVLLTMITTFGLEENKHSIGCVQNTIGLNDLFEPASRSKLFSMDSISMNLSFSDNLNALVTLFM